MWSGTCLIRHPLSDKGPNRPPISYEGEGGSNRFELGLWYWWVIYTLCNPEESQKDRKTKNYPNCQAQGPSTTSLY